MSFFKKYPTFFITITVLLLLAIGGLVYDFMAASKSSDAARKFKSAQNDLRAALNLAPAPTSDNLKTSEENIKALESVLAEQIKSTQGLNPNIISGSVPTSGTDMYYDLVAYKNELDKNAKAVMPIGALDQGVVLPENFDWGFSRYLEAGAGSPPKDADIPAIFEQKQILNYLLRKLLATGPQSMVSVQREPVVLDKATALQQESNSSSNQEDLKADEFWVGAESAEVEGAIETMGFSISFTGYSLNLRTFLKEIAAFDLPIVVRSVEVKPYKETQTASNTNNNNTNNLFSIFGGDDSSQEDAEAAVEANQEPVVDANISEFTIVIEYINVTLES